MQKSNHDQPDGLEKLPEVPHSDEMGQGVPANGTTGVAPGSNKPKTSGGLGPIASGGTTIVDIS